MSGKPPRRISTASITQNQEERLRDVENPRNPPWMYLTPVAPAAIPDDYVNSYVAYAPFEDPWVNIGTDANGRAVAPSAFRIFEGKIQLRLACTGGEMDAPSLIATLPVGFRPAQVQPFDVVMGDDKLQRGSIELRSNGELWFLGFTCGCGPTRDPAAWEDLVGSHEPLFWWMFQEDVPGSTLIFQDQTANDHDSGDWRVRR